MKKVSFRVRNFDKEQFLTYNIDNDAELDEEVLDFLEDEEPKGIVPIIYEEEEEFDTFSYDVTDKIRVCELAEQEINAEMTLKVMRGMALSLIDMAEYRIPLSYLVLHRNYIYINSDYEVEFICIPVEEMKEEVNLRRFLRRFVAALRFDSSEDMNYVARLLNYINDPTGINLRNMVTMIEEIMDDMGIEIPEDSSADIYVEYQEVEDIEEPDVSVQDDEVAAGDMTIEDVDVEEEAAIAEDVAVEEEISAAEEEEIPTIDLGVKVVESDKEKEEPEDSVKLEFEEEKEDTVETQLTEKMEKAVDTVSEEESEKVVKTESEEEMKESDEETEASEEEMKASEEKTEESVDSKEEAELETSADIETQETDDSTEIQSEESMEESVETESEELKDTVEAETEELKTPRFKMKFVKPKPQEPAKEAATEENEAESKETAKSESKKTGLKVKIEPPEEKEEEPEEPLEKAPEVTEDTEDVAESENKEEQESSLIGSLRKKVASVVDSVTSESVKKETKTPTLKTRETPAVTGVVIQDELDEFLAEKEKEEQEKLRKHEDYGLKIKKNIKVSRASIVSNQEEQKAEEEAAEKESIETAEKEKATEKEVSSSNEDASNTSKPAEAPKANPYLVRVNTEERIMITKQNFKIGKAVMGVDYTVHGNGAVSRVHAIIVCKDDDYYVKDSKSTNHTMVNGKVLEDGESELLTHDCKIVLGDEEFIFKLR